MRTSVRDVAGKPRDRLLDFFQPWKTLQLVSAFPSPGLLSFRKTASGMVYVKRDERFTLLADVSGVIGQFPPGFRPGSIQIFYTVEVPAGGGVNGVALQIDTLGRMTPIGAGGSAKYTATDGAVIFQDVYFKAEN